MPMIGGSVERSAIEAAATICRVSPSCDTGRLAESTTALLLTAPSLPVLGAFWFGGDNAFQHFGLPRVLR
jgi:hypothetical protein